MESPRFTFAKGEDKIDRESDARATAGVGSVAYIVPTVLVERNSRGRERLRRILSGTRFRVVKAVESLEDLDIPKILTRGPILLLIGADEDSFRTISEVKLIRTLNPASRIVVLGDDRDLDSVTAVFREGGDGYVRKRIERDALIKSLSLVMRGQAILPVEISRLLSHMHDETTGTRRFANSAPAPFKRNLSERQMDILFRLMKGESNKAIARRFDISEATVKVHIRAIMRIIAVKNRTQAAIWAMNHIVDVAPARTVRIETTLTARAKRAGSERSEQFANPRVARKLRPL